MAPKKNAADLQQKVAKKGTPKDKTAKAKLKTPTVVRIRLGPPPRQSKKVTKEENIELTNEVIRAQLAKTSPKNVVPFDPQLLLAPDTIKCEPNTENSSVQKTIKRKSSKVNIDDDLTKKGTEPAPKRKRNSKTPISPDPLSNSATENPPLPQWKIIGNSLHEFKKKPGPKSKTLNAIRTLNIPLVKLPENGGSIGLKQKTKMPAQTAKKTPKKVAQKNISNFIVEDNEDEDELEQEDFVKPPPKKKTKEKKTLKKPAKSKGVKKSRDAAEVKRPRARSKFVSERSEDNVSTRTRGQGKDLNAKQIRDAASKVEDALTTSKTSLHSRSNSMASSRSNLSWTKDISSSSTTTCVTVSSFDFVRIDNKLPIIQLNNIEHKSKEMDEESSSSDSDSSSSSVTDITTRPELNLSTSSMYSRSEDFNYVELLTKEIDKLGESMKRFDLFMGKYLDLSEDIDLICNDDIVTTLIEAEPVENVKSPEFSKASAARPAIVCFSEPTPVVPMPVENVSRGGSETFTIDNHNYVPFGGSNDDEDTLSLFAESLTGIESSRISSATNVSVAHETYIPKPKTPIIQEYTYKPTKIDETKKNVCEYQNADSTSILKDIDVNKVEVPVTINAKLNESNPPKNPRPQLLKETHTAVSATRSVVFRGLCFFHLASYCKNFMCRFPHIEPNIKTIQDRIASLSEKAFIEEYLLMCNFPALHLKFGLLFVTECLQREATRILIEMAIDICCVPPIREDKRIQVAVLELTLAHLNQISFDACDDLLKYPVKDSLLCLELLRSIAESQNFGRFTCVFTKLAEFLEEIKKPADLEVVGKILERVCILPSEDRLARAMWILIKNTDPDIFQHGMMTIFEKHLSNLDSCGVDLYDDYLLCKMAALTQIEKSIPVPPKDRERYTSPDTTNIDGLKKAMVQLPKITRTVDFSQPNTPPVTSLFKSPAIPAPRRHFTPQGATWRHMGQQGAMKGPHGPLRGPHGPLRGYNGPRGHNGPLRGHNGPLRGHNGPLGGHQGPLLDRRNRRKPYYGN